MPFHSVDTMKEAEHLVLFNCRLGYDGLYRVRVIDWNDTDESDTKSMSVRELGRLQKALQSAAKQFGVY